MTKQASLLDPADDLTQVLGPELAAHFLAHRKALKKPMTSYAAKLMATKLRAMPDPVGSVNQSILRGWDDVYEVKPQLLQKTQQFDQQPSGMDALEQDLRNRIDEHRNGRGSRVAGERGDRVEPVQAVSLLGWEGQTRSH